MPSSHSTKKSPWQVKAIQSAYQDWAGAQQPALTRLSRGEDASMWDKVKESFSQGYGELKSDFHEGMWRDTQAVMAHSPQYQSRRGDPEERRLELLRLEEERARRMGEGYVPSSPWLKLTSGGGL